jgi:molybdopterin-guanine dinucleotide biosynthesis protein MobB
MTPVMLPFSGVPYRPVKGPGPSLGGDVKRRYEPFVVGVVGNSGVGKTTLLEELIPELTGRGLAVGVVKHASHGFDVDRPGKDSQRLYASGPAAVALASDAQVATFVRPERDSHVSLSGAMAGLPSGLDVVLVEGFAWEPIPRFVLVGAGGSPRREHRESGTPLRIVEVAEPPPGNKPVYARDLLREIALEIVRHLRPRAVPDADVRTPAVLSESRCA